MLDHDLTRTRLAYTIQDAADALTVPRHHIDEAIKSLALIPRRIGPRSLLWRDDLEAWFRTHPRPHDRRRRQPPATEEEAKP